MDHLLLAKEIFTTRLHIQNNNMYFILACNRISEKKDEEEEKKKRVKIFTKFKILFENS